MRMQCAGLDQKTGRTWYKSNYFWWFLEPFPVSGSSSFIQGNPVKYFVLISSLFTVPEEDVTTELEGFSGVSNLFNLQLFAQTVLHCVMTYSVKPWQQWYTLCWEIIVALYEELYPRGLLTCAQCTNTQPKLQQIKFANKSRYLFSALYSAKRNATFSESISLVRGQETLRK